MTWINKPNDFTNEVLKTFDKKTKNVLGFGLQKIVVGSAVDSGAFRGNTRVSVDSADNGFDETIVDKGGASTIAKGGAVIASVKSSAGHVFYFQNNAPYGYRLEMGWSPQPTSHNLFALTAQAMKNKFDAEFGR